MVMKKVIVVFLVLLMFAGCSKGGVAQAEYDELEEEYEELQDDFDSLESKYKKLQKQYNDLKESSDELAKQWEEIQPGYQEYLKQKEQEILDSTDMILFESWAGLISEKTIACEVDDETAMVVVYAEGRTLNELSDLLLDKIATYRLLLESSDYSRSIIAVLGDNNEVMFGLTLSLDNEVELFIGRQYVN